MPNSALNARLKALLPERAYRDETRLVQYPQVSGYSGLMDSGVLDDLTHRFLAALQRLDNAASGAIGECCEGVYIHSSVYRYLCILLLKNLCQCNGGCQHQGVDDIGQYTRRAMICDSDVAHVQKTACRE